MAATLKLSQLISALSYALDITEGQPEGHCLRSCWIGMHIGRAIGLEEQALWELYYTILLKDLGCSSNAARISELYLADDRRFKQAFKQVGASLPQMLGFVFSQTGTHADGWRRRAASIFNVLLRGKEMADELINTRCHRGADIARQLRFNEGVAMGIQCAGRGHRPRRRLVRPRTGAGASRHRPGRSLLAPVGGGRRRAGGAGAGALAMRSAAGRRLPR